MRVQGAGRQRPGGGGGEVGGLGQPRVEPGQRGRGSEGVIDGDAGAPRLPPLPIVEAGGQRPGEGGGGRGGGGGLARVRGVGAGDGAGHGAGPVHTGHPGHTHPGEHHLVDHPLLLHLEAALRLGEVAAQSLTSLHLEL